jgi:hypothetical protein
MTLHGLLTPLNISSSTHQSRFLDVQKAGYEFSGPFAFLKYHLNDRKIRFIHA